MTPYPIVNATTADGLVLHGLLTEPSQPTRTLVIHIHGAAGNFYGNRYFKPLTTAVVAAGGAFLATNNRGSGVYELEKGTVPHGVSLERFEDSVLDLDAWIELALERGYERVVLEGHSYGTEKIVHYMAHGTYRDRVAAIILFGFSDNVGSQQLHEAEAGRRYLEEARELVDQGESQRLLDDLFGLCGELPISAGTYLDCFDEGSANSTALPLRQGRKLALFRAIRVPILAVIGDRQESEYTVISIEQAIRLLRQENDLAEVYQIQDCDHVFTGKEQQLADLVVSFLQRRV